MPNLIDLKEYIDLGGVFILALVLLWSIGRKLDSMEEKLVKVLTLLVVIVKQSTDFNHMESVLGKDSDGIMENLVSAKNSKKA